MHPSIEEQAIPLLDQYSSLQLPESPDDSNSFDDDAPDDLKMSLPRRGRYAIVYQYLGAARNCRVNFPSFNSCFSLIIHSVLLPSFIANRNSPAKEQRPTSYLDGVRGVAAFLVFMHHTFVEYFQNLNRGYNSRPDAKWIAQLPLIRTLYTGAFMVAIFFVLSGFVLSVRPLQLIRARKCDHLLANLSSSVFRRGLRLFLPMIPSTFVSFILGYYDLQYPWKYAIPLVPADVPAGHAKTLSEQMFKWLWGFCGMLNPFNTNADLDYNPHLWTIPWEFRGSIVVFLLLLCFAKIRVIFRLALISIAAFYCMWHMKSEIFLFIAGIFLGECHLIRQGQDSVTIGVDSCAKERWVKILVKILWILVFILAVWVGGWPLWDAEHSLGFEAIYKNRMVPAQWVGKSEFYFPLAAVVFVTACENCSALQRPFTTPLAQYLGKISFALYILHFPWNSFGGHYLIYGAIGLTSHYTLGYILGQAVSVPCLIWLADIYTRLVDDNCIRLARWLFVTTAVK